MQSKGTANMLQEVSDGSFWSSLSRRVPISELTFTDQARIGIGLAVRDMAEASGLPVAQVIAAVSGEVYAREDQGVLVIALRLPDKCDLFVEIPPGQWNFRRAGLERH